MTKASYVSLIRYFTLAAAFMPAIFLGACGGGSERNFVRDASLSNLFEIMSSQLAVQKAQTPELRQFAQQMIDDHTQATNQLKAITSAPNSGLPQPQTALDSRRQGMVDRLASATGTDFDKQYGDMQVEAHQQAITLFSDYSRNGDNDALKRFAADTLPVLQAHQQQIGQIRSGAAAPTGTTAPEGTLPEGTTAPSGTLPLGTPMTPEGTAVPEGTTAPGGTIMPEGTTSPGTTP
jgi:putative membrane protein